MRSLLVWGLLAGLVGGVLAFGFAEAFGERSVDAAIAIEERGAAAPTDDHGDGAGHSHDEGTASGHSHGDDGDEVISREFQSTGGLAIGTLAYGLGLGGLFGLAFAFAYGRLGPASPRGTAVALLGIGYTSVVLVPFLTYPANPPAVGNGDTIGQRTGLFFLVIAVSLVLAVLAVVVGRKLVDRLGGWTAVLVAALGYAVVMTVVAKLLPTIQEVPASFPAATLWEFRIASLGTSAVLWAGIAIAFATLLHRGLTKAR
ncbi:hypothetical protein BJP25_13450 [Actinokineospora bangkokensis]|uniref:Cobalt transporter n=1 Tax=Actinokineospora bangkokensis TaxID=1193682 RepID=A0A1Q9LQ15_9PSEU|nr:hypothetical protein BJP25_13450 [Actinokineospora bangkokensis]